MSGIVQDVHDGIYEGAGLIAPFIAPDQGGLIPDAAYEEFPVLPLAMVQNSPASDPVRSPDGWGTPAPGPPATVWVRDDVDSRRWWGGFNNETYWPDPQYNLLPGPNIPSDTSEHFSSWEDYMGGYPAIQRNAPPAFGFNLPEFDPNTMRGEW